MYDGEGRRVMKLGATVDDLTKMLRIPIIVINPCLLNARLAGCQGKEPMT